MHPVLASRTVHCTVITRGPDKNCWIQLVALISQVSALRFPSRMNYSYVGSSPQAFSLYAMVY